MKSTTRIAQLVKECRVASAAADSALARWNASGGTSHSQWLKVQAAVARLDRKTQQWEEATKA